MESFDEMDADKSQYRQFSCSQSETASKEAYDKLDNKNIEDLKQLQKTKKMFGEIFVILNCIATENDFKAMNFAVKEKFCDVKNSNDETIFDFSIKECNFQLAHLIIEFNGNNNHSHTIPKYSDFLRFFLKIQFFDVNRVLIFATKEGYYEVVKLLLTVPGIDVNTKDSDNKTALMKASRWGHDEVVKLLLTVPGIDINAKSEWYRRTALMEASRKGHHEVVKFLLTVPGIDVNAKDKYNNTALIYASYYGHHEVVKLLLTVPGIDVNVKDIKNRTALMKASRCGYDEVVKLLLPVPGINVNAKDEYNFTALMLASMYGYHEVVKLLLTVPGIDVNTKDN